MTPDPRLAPGTRYGRIWEKMVARRDRRVEMTYRLTVQSTEWHRYMDLGFEALHLGLGFLGKYKLGAYSERIVTGRKEG